MSEYLLQLRPLSDKEYTPLTIVHEIHRTNYNITVTKYIFQILSIKFLATSKEFLNGLKSFILLPI